MKEERAAPPADQAARDRFRREWQTNFAVSANAGSGKTTAISERLATMALAPEGAEILARTAVVTFTRKAAAQIGQRARAVLIRGLVAEARRDLAPLDHLDRAFFGTIHSFCLLLAQRHGQTLGLHLNPTVVETVEREEAFWEEFLEQDPMQFTALRAGQVEAFLRHAPLETIFPLARQMDQRTALHLGSIQPGEGPPEPSVPTLGAILAAASKGRGVESLRRNQEVAVHWLRRFREERGFLPMPRPEGTAAGIEHLFAEFFAPVKAWLAEAGAVLAAELAGRYRRWRLDRGVQTYADQVDSAFAVIHESATLNLIRQEGWRIVLDEAQDTDPQQFAVLVEVARAPGAVIGTWPEGGGPGPRPGHFCMVGDGQQSIYGSRADVRNFRRHLDAFARGDAGELLRFEVTFRAPRRLIEMLNPTLASAFGPGRTHNLGLPTVGGAIGPCLQVEYVPLVAADANEPGGWGSMAIVPAEARSKVENRLAVEVRQLAAWLIQRGPTGIGARHWGEVCLLAPRNEWLLTARKELERAGLQVALQLRRRRSGDNPVYAWLTGLVVTVCDPENTFEAVGVFREVFAISDAVLAVEIRKGPLDWDAPERHPAPLREALEVLQRFVARVDAAGEPLARFAEELVGATGLRAKVAAIDPAGEHRRELDRLLAQAAELSVMGAGPRAWRQELLNGLETGRPDGQERPEAINLLTAHSAKGLEWPVVIPIGMWRTIGRFAEEGLRMVAGDRGGPRVYFDRSSVPAAVQEALERERQRELVRLLYVTLTRCRRALILPVGERVEEGSFYDLWGFDLNTLPAAGAVAWETPTGQPPQLPGVTIAVVPPASAIEYPRRLLPHRLGGASDAVRGPRHESADEAPPAISPADPLEYGTWWHETAEFLPWAGTEAEVAAHLETCLMTAKSRGFGERAMDEIARLRSSEAWGNLRSGRWQILTEVSVMAPSPLDGGWVDGVIDLLAHDVRMGELLIVDWKTNRATARESSDMFLTRLHRQYGPQLEAYRRCLAGFFPGARLEVAVFSTALGAWRAW